MKVDVHPVRSVPSVLCPHRPANHDHAADRLTGTTPYYHSALSHHSAAKSWRNKTD
ncbi:hypothetical protein BDR03DRAFT_969527 [Suillus americanus]|nr:hypothetical protein BDR03DRAFT_969527 [Suillus americanus]